MIWRLLDQADVARHERQSGHEAEELPQVIVAAVWRAGAGFPGWIADQRVRRNLRENDVNLTGVQAMPFTNGGPHQHPPILRQEIRRQYEPECPGQHAVQQAADR